MSRVGLWATDRAQAYRAVAGALCSAGPALLFGLRLWAAVCLALYIAFWLQLDNPSWAGTSAAIVCQPSLGASLRKGWFRMIGTAAGAVAIVVLTACFPQDRLGFLLGLAVWGGACGLMVTLLRNFAPTRRHSPATPRRSSRATSSARLEARTATCLCSPSPAPAKSASASSARASFSPGPTSVALGDGWRSSSPSLRPKSPEGWAARLRLPERGCR